MLYPEADPRYQPQGGYYFHPRLGYLKPGTYYDPAEISHPHDFHHYDPRAEGSQGGQLDGYSTGWPAVTGVARTKSPVSSRSSGVDSDLTGSLELAFKVRVVVI